MPLRLLSLCTGYGGLDTAVVRSFAKRGREVELAAFAEFEPKIARVFSRHHPNLPNLGDITKIDWKVLPDFIGPVDIITAGYPCQPFSSAGAKRGVDDDRHIYPYIGRAIRDLRPRYAVLENVAGHRSRGFGEVHADLAEAGYDTTWASLRASDVGAPHRRERVVILATPVPDTDCTRLGDSA